MPSRSPSRSPSNPPNRRGRFVVVLAYLQGETGYIYQQLSKRQTSRVHSDLGFLSVVFASDVDWLEVLEGSFKIGSSFRAPLNVITLLQTLSQPLSFCLCVTIRVHLQAPLPTPHLTSCLMFAFDHSASPSRLRFMGAVADECPIRSAMCSISECSASSPTLPTLRVLGRCTRHKRRSYSTSCFENPDDHRLRAATHSATTLSPSGKLQINLSYVIFLFKEPRREKCLNS